VQRHDPSDTETLREVIEKASSETYKWVYDAAAMTLAALGPREPLIALLSSPFTHVRYVALGHSETDQATRRTSHCWIS
jgi:uroporphyrinogen-III decarboxylase